MTGSIKLQIQQVPRKPTRRIDANARAAGAPGGGRSAAGLDQELGLGGGGSATREPRAGEGARRC